jgi:hypothetical protein
VNAGKSIEKGWLDISEINANNDYISMNFVKELQKPGHQCIVNFIEFVEKNLGSDMDMIISMKDLFRKFLVSLEFTLEGAILEHMCKCFLTMIKNGCRAIPVFSLNTYCGCIVEGNCRFAVDKVLYVPENHIMEQIGKFCNNTSKLNEISTLAGIIAANVVSMRQLHVLLNSVVLSKSVMTSILKVGAYLVFPQRPLTTSHTNVIDIYTKLSDSTIVIDSLLFLHHSALFSNRDTSLLSAFGSTCPTFTVPQGKSLSLEKPFVVDKEWKMVYKMVTYERALLDIEEMKEKRKVPLYTKQLSKRQLEFIIPLKSQNDVYDVLKKIAKIPTSQVTESKNVYQEIAKKSILER